MKISLYDVGKVYGNDNIQVKAKPCTFSLESGEQVAVTGASGSGKSTLLHIIGGLDTPTWGTVTYDGRDIFEMSENKLAEFCLRNIGFVFSSVQSFAGAYGIRKYYIACTA